MAKDLTPENMESETKTGKVIIDFWAPWCGPCQMFKPIFEEVANDYKDINFAKANTEDHPELAMPYGVRGIPTVVFLKDGEEIGRFSGAYPKEMFVQEIEKHFG